MDYSNYEKVVGIIERITHGNSCCTMVISMKVENKENETINFILTGDTTVIHNVRLRPGMRIAAFYDTSLPAPAIFPPQYQAELITALRQNQEVMLAYFDENLEAQGQSLKLNLSPMTNISTINGQRYACAPINMELLVYYTAERKVFLHRLHRRKLLCCVLMNKKAACMTYYLLYGKWCPVQ